MSFKIRQAPLLDRDRDSQLFVAPEGYDRALWAVGEALNVLVLGERGQGKTSVLHQLELSLRQQQPQRRLSFVDLSPARSVEVALRLLVSSAVDVLDQPLSWSPPLPRPNESEAERNVRASLEQLAAFEACTFLIDNVNAADVGFALFGVLRDRLWETPHQWVVSGNRTDRRWLLRAPADAFWEEVIELQYSAQSARELLERRLEGSPSWIAPLVDYVGPNPRRLLRAALAAARDEHQPAAVLESWADWHQRLAALDRRSAMLMAELSGREPVSASDPELLSALGWARTSLIKTLEALEQGGLVESWSEPAGTGRPRRLFATTEPGSQRRG
ncbi:MAG: hypothetical protein ACLP22_04490 [Solirubrobacteraceae bacterium]